MKVKDLIEELSKYSDDEALVIGSSYSAGKGKQNKIFYSHNPKIMRDYCGNLMIYCRENN